MATVLLQASRFEASAPQQRFEQALCHSRITALCGRAIGAAFVRGLSHPCNTIEISHSDASIFYDRAGSNEEYNRADGKRRQSYEHFLLGKSDARKAKDRGSHFCDEI